MSPLESDNVFPKGRIRKSIFRSDICCLHLQKVTEVDDAKEADDDAEEDKDEG
jgi:hypothetical protein